MDATCPVLHRIDTKGKRTKVAVDGAACLESPSECCALTSIEVKSEGGATSALLGSNQPARDCFDGTATTDYLSLFKLTGNALELVKDYSIAWH